MAQFHYVMMEPRATLQAQSKSRIKKWNERAIKRREQAANDGLPLVEVNTPGEGWYDGLSEGEGR